MKDNQKFDLGLGKKEKEKGKMREVEATGKNIEQAVQNALLELKAAREDCDIRILNEGGFLKKAKVLVSISEDALEKYEKKEKFKKQLAQDETDEDFAESFMKKKSAKQENSSEKEVKKQEKETEPKTEKAERKVRIVTDEEISSKPQKEEQPQQQERKLISGEQFLNGVLKSLNLEGEIEKTEEEKFVRYSLKGDGLNDLIGHHGECMLALSQLMNSVCESNHKKIVLDVEGYRQKREESLIALAKRTADKVAKTGRYFKFEPMDASERKIIHTALQDDDRVTTLSKGDEPKRYLIVFPKEYDER